MSDRNQFGDFIDALAMPVHLLRSARAEPAIEGTLARSQLTNRRALRRRTEHERRYETLGRLDVAGC